MKLMKNIVTTLLLFTTLVVGAQTLTYKPINPFFGGNNPFAYQQILASVNAQNDFQEQGEDAFRQPSDLDNFTNSLNRQLLNSLSRNLFQEQIGDKGLKVGTYEFGSLVVEISPTTGGLLVNILNTQTGEQTQITIPNK